MLRVYTVYTTQLVNMGMVYYCLTNIFVISRLFQSNIAATSVNTTRGIHPELIIIGFHVTVCRHLFPINIIYA